MSNILYFLFTSSAFASPGSGHSHGAGDDLSKVLGVGIILLLAGVGFWFLKDKKK